MCTGENITIPKKNPPQVEKHRGQLISPDKNLPKKLNGANTFSPHLWIESLNPLNIDP